MEEFTHRDRVIRTLEHKNPDRVPYDLGLTLGAYINLLKYLGLSETEPLHPNQWLEVEPSIELTKILDLDIRTISVGHPKTSSVFQFGMETFTNEWRMNFRKVKQFDGNYYYELYAFPLARANMEDLEEFPWPDPADPGWTDGLVKKCKRIKEETDCAIIVEFPISIFEHAYMLRGFQQFLLDLEINPEFAASLMDNILQIALPIAQSIIQKAGKYIDVIKHLDDMGHQHGPLISPSMFRELIKPRFLKLFNTIKNEFAIHNPNGKIMTHTDGDVSLLIGDYIEAGVDILNCVQPNAGNMDHRRIKEKYGKILSFHGGVDVQYVMPFGTPEEVFSEVKKRIKLLGSGGGFILAPSHNLQHDVPPENIIALRDAVREFGQYPI